VFISLTRSHPPVCLFQELAPILVNYWSVIECTYLESSRHVFQMMRADRDQIIRYFYQMKFVHHITLPVQICLTSSLFISLWSSHSIVFVNCMYTDITPVNGLHLKFIMNNISLRHFASFVLLNC